MKKDVSLRLLAAAAGAAAGMIVGCMITWYPIRMSFCAAYHTPDCEEIVLMAFPLYCFIMPVIGGVSAYLLYRRQFGSQAGDGAGFEEAAGEDERGES